MINRIPDKWLILSEFKYPKNSTFFLSLSLSFLQHVPRYMWTKVPIIYLYLVVGDFLYHVTSVTSKKLPNVYKSCPKKISLEKIKDFDIFTKIA